MLFYSPGPLSNKKRIVDVVVRVDADLLLLYHNIDLMQHLSIFFCCSIVGSFAFIYKNRSRCFIVQVVKYARLVQCKIVRVRERHTSKTLASFGKTFHLLSIEFLYWIMIWITR